MFEQILANIPIEQRLLIIFIFGFPFTIAVVFFVWLKRKMRVGRVDLWEFGFVYVIVLACFFIVVVPYFLNMDIVITFLDLLGLVIGIPLGFILFNYLSFSGEVTLIKFNLVDFEADPPTCDEYSSHVYWKDGKQYIIWYDYEQHETATEFLKRMFGIKIELEWFIDPGFPMIDHGVNEVYFIEAMEETIAYKTYISKEYAKDDQGRILRDPQTGELLYEEHEVFEKWFGIKKKKVRKRIAVPVMAQRYSVKEFLTRFKDYETMSEQIGMLYNENMSLLAKQGANSYKFGARMVYTWMKKLGIQIPGISKKLEEIEEPQEEKEREEEKRKKREEEE